MKPHEWEQKTATEDWGSSGAESGYTYWVCKNCGIEGGTEAKPGPLGFITNTGLELVGVEDCETSALMGNLYSNIDELLNNNQRLKMKTQRQRQELKRLNRTIKGIRDIVLMCETLKRAQGE